MRISVSAVCLCATVVFILLTTGSIHLRFRQWPGLWIAAS